jgi:hypothetical protein
MSDLQRRHGDFRTQRAVKTYPALPEILGAPRPHVNDATR